MSNGAEYVRRELMIRFVRAFDAGIPAAELDRIPLKLRPRGGESSRCCIYHDRAVLRYRLMALLGFAAEEETDETRSLQSYYEEAATRAKPVTAAPLSVCDAGCSGCPDRAYFVTDNCRGCFARPCMYNCPRDAVKVVNQAARIDPEKCIKCGRCQAVCPFHAIVKTTVPCEEACPVGAIRKNARGQAEIDFDRCIFCGKCFNQCPFSAIMERSQLLDVLRALQDPQVQLAALVAPSASAQFPGTIEQLFSAVAELGFDEVIEVALGAELTAAHEAEEFRERIAHGEKLMTSSCCPAYVELVRRHLPDFLPHVSDTPSPMRFAAQLAADKFPGMKTVFIGPCIAKRHEAFRSGGIDYVLTFEELGAILGGRKIDIITRKPWPLPRPAAATARNFARSCGVTEAVLAGLMPAASDFKLDAKFLNGIDKKSLNLLKLYAAGKLPANFLEVMACPGGCVNGPCSLTKA